MNADAMREAVRETLEKFEDQLGIRDWDVTIDFERLEEGTAGKTTVHPEYRVAQITLDPEQSDTRDYAIRALRHELIHVFAWPYNGLGRIATAFFPDDDAGDALMREFHFYMERLVGDIERLVDRLTGDDITSVSEKEEG